VSAILCLGAECISLTKPDLDNLARVISVVQQQLCHYIIALPDFVSYVTSSLTSVSYVETVPDATKNIDYPHLYQELVTFV